MLWPRGVSRTVIGLNKTDMVFPPPGNAEKQMNQLATTPDCLQKQFGMPPEAGPPRAMPRAFMAYEPPRPPRGAGRLREIERRRRAPRKLDVIKTISVLIMAEVLPAQGDNPKWRAKRVTQDRLAAMLGMSRPAFTRMLSRMANPHGQAARDAANWPALQLIERVRQFAIANDYAIAESAVAARASRPRRDAAEAVSYPTVSDLCAHPRSGGLFRSDARADGYKLVPKWIFDPRLTLSAPARLVMTYYVMCGLLEKGVCNPRQSTVASAIGLSVRGVRRANVELAAIGLIRVAHPKPEKHPDGRIERGAQIVIYVPGRTLDRETASDEAKRLAAAKNRLQAQYAAFWDGITTVHGSMLHQWMGKEHSIAAFHRAVREQLARYGVPKGAIDALFPFQPSD
jgi:hypothetical protein